MKLSYSDLIGYAPIPVEIDECVIGHIRKPLLSDIDQLGWRLFEVYESALTLTPQALLDVMTPNGKELWNELSKSSEHEVKLFDIITLLPPCTQFYLDILHFFFVEPVIFANGVFWVLKHEYEMNTNLTKDDVYGAVTRENFHLAVDIMQCVCCIHNSKQDGEKDLKFKNKLAEELYHKMHGGENEDKTPLPKKIDKNLTTANIISAVANVHPSLNYTNIYQLTLPQLYDVFQRMQQLEIYDLQKRQVSIWGDEKNKFDMSSWYHNLHDQ